MWGSGILSAPLTISEESYDLIISLQLLNLLGRPLASLQLSVIKTHWSKKPCQTVGFILEHAVFNSQQKRLAHCQVSQSSGQGPVLAGCVYPKCIGLRAAKLNLAKSRPHLHAVVKILSISSSLVILLIEGVIAWKQPFINLMTHANNMKHASAM